jgi:hypothetical protein
LKGVVLAERGLHGMQLAILRQSFNRSDIATIGLNSKHGA